jgi:hypothetical protein
MPTAVLEQASFADAPRKRWTRAECAAVEATGIWEQQHLELVDGELISKMGKKRPHVNTLSLVYARLIGVFGPQFVNPEAPIDVAPGDNPINEPEPDIIVLARPLHQIKSGNPQPSEIRLVVEISDTTLGFDLKIKALRPRRHPCTRARFSRQQRVSRLKLPATWWLGSLWSRRRARKS